MWIFTTIGFFSIVQHHEEENCFLVRARAKKDLVNLCKEIKCLNVRKIYRDDRRDYHHRIFIRGTELITIMAWAAHKIDYTNFKDAVMKNPNQKDKKEPLHKVWTTMWNYQWDVNDENSRKNKKVKVLHELH